MSLIVVGGGLAVACALVLVTFPFLGQLALVLGAVVGLGSGYAVAAIPRRSIERSALEQARESPALAAAASVYLQSSGSKSKTVLMLRSEEPRLSAMLGELRRTTLLGMDPADSSPDGREDRVRVGLQDNRSGRQGPGREARRRG